MKKAVITFCDAQVRVFLSFSKQTRIDPQSVHHVYYYTHVVHIITQLIVLAIYEFSTVKQNLPHFVGVKLKLDHA